MAAVAVLGLIVHVLLLARWTAGVPGAVRLFAAFTVLVLLPGLAIRRAIGAQAPGGVWIGLGWALGFGVAWNAVWILAFHLAHLPFLELVRVAPWATAVLWGLAFWRGPRALAAESPGRVAGALILAAMLVAAWNAFSLGTYITYYSDSPDHIGTIRRMLETGVAFPTDAFFRGVGAVGADPRKGLWHPQVAMIARLAAVDPYLAWRDLSALLSPLMVLNVAALGWLIAGRAGAAVAAWMLVMTYGGSLAAQPLRETVYSTKLADQLALATTVAVFADLRSPGWRARAAAVGLGFAAIATHLFASVQFAIVFLALGIGMMIRDRGLSAEGRRFAVTVLAIAAAGLPILLLRAASAYGPRNPIHTEPQGLLLLTDSLRVVSPGAVWTWTGPLVLLFPLFAWSLWRDGRMRTPVLYLLTTAVAVALIICNPLAIAVLEPLVGYLLMRMVWLLPVAGLLTWILVRLARELRSGTWAARRGALAGGVVVLLLFAPALGDSVHALVRPQSTAMAEWADSPMRWAGPLAWMNRSLEPGVVLADPATSYSIPMMTRHWVVTLVDQHSSPNDPDALERLLDARDALDPYADWRRTREVIDHYGVDYIVLNGRFEAAPHFDYWAPSRRWFSASRERFDRHPGIFPRLYEEDGFVVYGVNRGALDTLSEPPRPRVFVQAVDPAHTPPARRIGEGLPALQGLRLSPAQAARGDTVSAVIEWRALEPYAAGSYTSYVRFDRPLPGGFDPPRFVAKPLRKVIERYRHERYRFRADRLPLGGRYGVDLWQEGHVVRDSFAIVVPRDIAQGVYDVRVTMLRQPHYANFRLSDYFFDDDYYAGLLAGQLEVRDPGASPADPPARTVGNSGGH